MALKHARNLDSTLHSSLCCIEKVLRVALGLMAGLKEPPLPPRLARCARLSPAELSEGHRLSWAPKPPTATAVNQRHEPSPTLCCNAAGLLAHRTPVHPLSLCVIDVQCMTHAKENKVFMETYVNPCAFWNHF